MLKIHRRELAHETIFSLQGSIVTGETSRLSELVVSHAEKEVVVLDLARVNRIDARGLGGLLELRAQLLTNGKELKLRDVTRPVRRVLEITRLNSVFEILPEERTPAFVLRGRPTTVFERACA